MSYSSLPTVSVGEGIKASWGNQVDADLDDLDARTIDLETAATGTVVGPASAMDNALVRYDGTTGKLVQNSTVTLPDDGRISTVTDPSSAQDVATKSYVDGIAVNLGKRARARAATTANITIATALNNGDTLDSVTLATGDFVLVKNQSSAAENGVYVVGVTPARSSEFDSYDEHPGSLVAVEEGTAGADTLWLCTSNVGGTISVTAIVFSQIAVAAITQLTGDVTAGPGSGSQAATIPNDTVTNAKLANMAQSTIKGRAVSAGTGDPTDLTATQATAVLDVMVGDSGSGGTKGLVPAPAAGDAAAGKFLKADGTYAAPSGSGAPSSSQYVTLALDGGLSAERVLTAGAGITLTDAGANSTITIAAAGIGIAKIVRKTADESVTSSTTLQNDDELLFAIGANEVWQYEIIINLIGSETGDFKVGVEHPSGSTVRVTCQAIVVGTAATANSGQIAMFSSATATGGAGFGVSASTVATVVIFNGMVVNGATPGNVQLVWAQNTSDGTATTVKANSYIIAHRVA